MPRRDLETPVASEYTIAYSKAPHGLISEKVRGIPIIDPAVAGRDSEVTSWLRHFWLELTHKFKGANDAFRQFNISKKGKVTFAEFNYMLDTLSIRFSKE